jgi:hypothetical protein
MKIEVKQWVIDAIFPEYKNIDITKLPRKKKKKVKKHISKELIKISMKYAENLILMPDNSLDPDLF